MAETLNIGRHTKRWLRRLNSKLAVKVAALSLLPLVLFGLIAMGLGWRTTTTFYTSLGKSFEEQEQSLAAEMAVLRVEASISDILQAINRASLSNSQLLLSVSDDGPAEVELAYAALHKTLLAHRLHIQGLDRQLKEAGLLEQEETDRRLGLLASGSDTILGLFEVALESSRETVAAVAAGNLEAARADALFKEVARLHTLSDLAGENLFIVNEMAEDLTSELKQRIRQRQTATEAEILRQTQTGLAVGAVSVLLFALAAMWLTTRHISRPLAGMATAMKDLSHGNLEVEIPGETRSDEIGSMVLALQFFRGNLAVSENLRAEKAQRMAEDLTDARQQLHDAVESISEGFAIWDAKNCLIMCNSRYAAFYPSIADKLTPGVNYETFLRAAFEEGIFDLQDKDLEATIEDWVQVHKTSARTVDRKFADGRWVRVTKHQTNSGNTVGIMADITNQVKNEATFRRMALQDPLTGLANRSRFNEDLRSALDQADRTDRRVGVMLLDLDRFKKINDTLGHAAGDSLLKLVAGRIQSCLRKTDTVARLGGDEFAVIATNVKAVEDIHMVGERIIAALAKPFAIDGQEINTGTSIGLTIYPDDPADQDQLLRNADLALYEAKASGRGLLKIFDQHLHDTMLARSSMAEDLRKALAEDQFSMVFQPQFEIATGRVVSAESLIRWQHPERGSISPSDFIPVAESTQQIVALDKWVIRSVCKRIAEWQRDGLSVPRVSINISPLHFRQDGLPEFIERTLAQNGVDPKRLEIEITEGMAAEANDAALATMNRLQAMGIGLSIDDFGTGYSSLSRLKDFPVDRLKIDQSFIRNITTSENDAAISSAVIHLGHTLGLRVIAEGVENRDQLEHLAETGCDEVQGFYFSKPLPAAEFVTLLRAHETKPLLDSKDPAPAAKRAKRRAS